MNGTTLKKVAERRPFRPFAVRLNNGEFYAFKERRELGAPKNYREIFYFGKSDWVLIDSESIAEIIQQ